MMANETDMSRAKTIGGAMNVRAARRVETLPLAEDTAHQHERYKRTRTYLNHPNLLPGTQLGLLR